MNPLISLKSVSYSYEDASKKALENVSLNILPGDFVGLVGPNGAGKTTLMSCLSSLLVPTEGNIHFENNRPQTWVSLAPQEVALYPTLTAEENLKFFAAVGNVPKENIQERVDWCLEFVGLTPQKKVAPHSYSGGMKRRLNIAIALVTTPKFLLLDEPTVGVDPHSRYLILKALSELNKMGTAILYSSHYLEEVEKFCKTLILLDHGKVQFNGTMKEFMESKGNVSSLEQRFIEWTGTDTRDV